MAWLGSVREVQYYLGAVGADRGDDGRFIISGAPPHTGSEPDRLIIPDGTVYFRRGNPFLLADAMGRTSYGTTVSEVLSASNGRKPNPIPKGQREKVRKATKKLDRELVKRLKGETWSMSIRDAMPKYSVVVYIEDCPGRGDFDRRMSDVLEAFKASGLDKHLYFDGTDYGPLPGPEATPEDTAAMACAERGYHFYDASTEHPPGVDIGDPGYRAAAAWERQCIEEGLSRAADAPRRNPGPDRRGVASGKVFKLGGVPYELPPGLYVQWSPVNEGWIVTWHDTVLRVISDEAELKSYIKELGATAINPKKNPRYEAHRAAYHDYLKSATHHLDAAAPLLAKGQYEQAFGAIRHAECDVRQAYTEAVYAKRSDADLARMVTPLEEVYARLQTQIRMIQEQL
jgi:hypothetical protein